MYKNPSQLQEIGSLDGEKLIFEVCPENQNEKPKLRSSFCTFLFASTSGFFNCGANQSIAI